MNFFVKSILLTSMLFGFSGLAMTDFVDDIEYCAQDNDYDPDESSDIADCLCSSSLIENEYELEDNNRCNNAQATSIWESDVEECLSENHGELVSNFIECLEDAL